MWTNWSKQEHLVCAARTMMGQKGAGKAPAKPFKPLIGSTHPELAALQCTPLCKGRSRCESGSFPYTQQAYPQAQRRNAGA
ncbi:hypothetical protein GCM10009425_06980 [Pseudomonas asuensis]|uniref:Uncharacterized protein n=1 Tax=Pseudomonas asuensis TaxID=1825787 RepID=A0ABQ2GIS1_9PSED|nr:hypothetical protein GCM10009425_06980 [Pseudomonas asuensis]